MNFKELILLAEDDFMSGMDAYENEANITHINCYWGWPNNEKQAGHCGSGYLVLNVEMEYVMDYDTLTSEEADKIRKTVIRNEIGHLITHNNTKMIFGPVDSVEKIQTAIDAYKQQCEAQGLCIDNYKGEPP